MLLVAALAAALAAAPCHGARAGPADGLFLPDTQALTQQSPMETQQAQEAAVVQSPMEMQMLVTQAVQAATPHVPAHTGMGDAAQHDRVEAAASAHAAAFNDAATVPRHADHHGTLILPAAGGQASAEPGPAAAHIPAGGHGMDTIEQLADTAAATHGAPSFSFWRRALKQLSFGTIGSYAGGGGGPGLGGGFGGLGGGFGAGGFTGPATAGGGVLARPGAFGGGVRPAVVVGPGAGFGGGRGVGAGRFGTGAVAGQFVGGPRAGFFGRR